MTQGGNDSESLSANAINAFDRAVGMIVSEMIRNGSNNNDIKFAIKALCDDAIYQFKL